MRDGPGHDNIRKVSGICGTDDIVGYFWIFRIRGYCAEERRPTRPTLFFSATLDLGRLAVGIEGSVQFCFCARNPVDAGASLIGRGPFARQGPLHNALSLQLFLFFVAIPFTFLAVLVEEQKRAQQILIDDEARLAEAQRLAHVGSWQWDLQTDMVAW